MERSEQINELAAALARAQGKFEAVARGAENPFFKSKYATLDDMIAAVRGPLSEAGLAYSQLVDQSGSEYTLTTLLIHESGQFISATTGVNPSGGRGTNDLQALGSALTYMKRYQLGAMLGVNTEADDDGNAGGTSGNGQKKQSSPPQSEAAKAAREKKRQIEMEQQSVKAAWIAEAKSTGHLSAEPTSDQWAALIELMGETYKAISTATDGFDELRDAGLEIIRNNAPQPEPEQDADDLDDEDTPPCAGTAPHYSDN